MNRHIEMFSQNNEQPKTQAELEQLLAEARVKLESEQNRAGEFYDIELYKTFQEAIGHFAGNIEALELYMNSLNGYERAQENLDKKVAFDNTYIKPIKLKIRDLEKELNALKNKEHYAQQEQLEKEHHQKESEDFAKEKQMLEEKLYTALDNIHAQIPKEATDAGMSTEAALKVYLPNLADRAHMLEYFINELSGIDTPYSLNRFKQYLDSSIKDL